MKKALILSLAGLFFAGMAHAQNDNNSNKHETIEGNGKKVTREVTVSGFDVLEASGVYTN